MYTWVDFSTESKLTQLVHLQLFHNEWYLQALCAYVDLGSSIPCGGVTDKGDKLILKEGVRGFYLKWREHDENTGKV